MQTNHFSDSLQATCNQPKRVNCYTIQVYSRCSKLRVIWIRSDKFNKSKPCEHETLVPPAAFSLVTSQERVIWIRSGKFNKVKTMRA